MGYLPGSSEALIETGEIGPPTKIANIGRIALGAPVIEEYPVGVVTNGDHFFDPLDRLNRNFFNRTE